MPIIQSNLKQAENINRSLKDAEPHKTINRANQAARNTFSNFTSNISSGIAKGLNYANPVTFGKSLWKAAGQLPERMAQYDRDYGDRVRNNLAQTQAKAEAYSQRTSQPKEDFTKYNEPVVQRKTKVPPPGSEQGKPPTVRLTPEPSQSPYANRKVTYSKYDGSGPYVPLDRSELVRDETGAPMFDNTFMKKRYGNDVHQPMTPERLEAQRLASMSPQQRQQQFDNELAVRRLGLDIRKRNDSAAPRLTPRFSDIYDDNYNIVGSRYDGSFNPRTGRYTPAQQQVLNLTQPEMEALSQAKELSKNSPEAMSVYQQLLQKLGLPDEWAQYDE